MVKGEGEGAGEGAGERRVGQGQGSSVHPLGPSVNGEKDAPADRVVGRVSSRGPQVVLKEAVVVWQRRGGARLPQVAADPQQER